MNHSRNYRQSPLPPFPGLPAPRLYAAIWRGRLAATRDVAHRAVLGPRHPPTGVFPSYLECKTTPLSSRGTDFVQSRTRWWKTILAVGNVACSSMPWILIVVLFYNTFNA